MCSHPAAPLAPVLAVLNEALQADRHAITMLLENRIPASFELADHPTIQLTLDEAGNPMVGALGVLNGVIQTLTGKRVAAVYEEEDGINWVTGFVEYQDPAVPTL